MKKMSLTMIGKKIVPVKEPVVSSEMKEAWDCVKSICPHMHISFKYNEEENSIELEDAFYICYDYLPESKVGKYFVSLAKYLPGDRETPPDVDIVDLESFLQPIQAVQFAIKTLRMAEIDMVFSDYSETRSYDQEMAEIEKQ